MFLLICINFILSTTLAFCCEIDCSKLMVWSSRARAWLSCSRFSSLKSSLWAHTYTNAHMEDVELIVCAYMHEYVRATFFCHTIFDSLSIRLRNAWLQWERQTGDTGCWWCHQKGAVSSETCASTGPWSSRAARNTRQWHYVFLLFTGHLPIKHHESLVWVYDIINHGANQNKTCINPCTWSVLYWALLPQCVGLYLNVSLATKCTPPLLLPLTVLHRRGGYR